MAGINRAVSVEEAEAFLEGLGDGAAVMLKALAGGGGRGMRAVEEVAQLADAYRRCRAEAQAAFGRARAAALWPKRSRTSACGPTKWMPARGQRRANSPFSARKP
ncbi:ATP-binding protein [Enterobacter hormaechei]|uniref:ATP-binding protein n=1 Tax=Enterobacter hormaechei TaxID=158836 RepID=UPI0035A3D11D